MNTSYTSYTWVIPWILPLRHCAILAPSLRRLLVTAHRKGRIRQVVAAHPGSLSGPRTSLEKLPFFFWVKIQWINGNIYGFR